MPQIEKITYITTVYWILISYFIVYLDLIVTYLYKFLTSLKFDLKRLALILTKTLKRNLEQYILRVWAKQPANIVWGFILIELVPVKSSEISKGKKPDALKSYDFYELLRFAKESFFYWKEQFDSEQWEWSLGMLVFVMYPFVAMFYNWYSAKHFYGGWLTWTQRLIFILLDLLLNCIFGPMAIMSDNPVLCDLMKRCPIALSPIFIVAEFVLFFSYKNLQKQLWSLETSTDEIIEQQQRIIIWRWFVKKIVLNIFLLFTTVGIAFVFNESIKVLSIPIAIFSLVLIIHFIIFHKIKSYINKGQWKDVSNCWRKEAELKDKTAGEKKHIVRHIVSYRKADLEREIARKPSIFEQFYSPIYKLFKIKTRREKYIIELGEINKKNIIVLAESNWIKRYWVKTSFSRGLKFFKNKFYDKPLNFCANSTIKYVFKN